MKNDNEDHMRLRAAPSTKGTRSIPSDDYRALHGAVTKKLGDLKRNGRFHVTATGQRVRLLVSSPFNGKPDLGRIRMSETHFALDWLALKISNNDAVWLILMRTVEGNLRSVPAKKDRERHSLWEPRFGPLDGTDSLWVKRSAKLDICEFRIVLPDFDRELELGNFQSTMWPNALSQVIEARLESERDFRLLHEAVTARLGMLRAESRLSFRSSDGQTVRLAVSAPTTSAARAAITISDDRFRHDWLAMKIKGFCGIWMIPMRVLKEFLLSLPPKVRGDGRATWHASYGPLDGVDKLTVQGRSLELFDYRIGPTARDAPRERRREKLQTAKQAEERAALLGRKLKDNPDLAALHSVVTARFGALGEYDNMTAGTADGQRIKLALSKPFHRDMERAFIRVSAANFHCDWLAVGIKGGGHCWIIPMPRVEAFLRSIPTNRHYGGNPIWDPHLGPRNGTDSMWVSRRVTLDISKYRIELSKPTAYTGRA